MASQPSSTTDHASQGQQIANIASLQDKVALITGGSSGLGRAIAQAYAAAGAYIVNADLAPNPPPAPVIAQTVKDEDFTTPTVELVNTRLPGTNGNRASFVKCDVTDEESVRGAVKFAVERYGRLDIMVNNAGISAESSQTSPSGAMPRIHETDVSVLDKTLAVNVRGVWLGTKHAVAQFLAQEPRRGRRGNGLTYSDTDPTNSISGSNSHPDSGTNSNENPTSVSASVSTSDSATEIHRGWIINLASILGSVGLPGASSYSASKGAVLQLTRATALEYARDGIHINALQPGFTDTHILENMYARSPGAAQHLSTLHPWGRTGRAEEIARAAVFLAGEGASWITGTSIAVDGGYLAQ